MDFVASDHHDAESTSLMPFHMDDAGTSMALDGLCNNNTMA